MPTRLSLRDNYVAHAYDSINDGIIWSIVINHLPPLKAEVERLLG
ncbi:MAG: DUF86 domain-containing protein [Bacteroidales bacterium]|nr:DUF86 domain-containing protein [Bacteroidales bacterium]